MIALKTSVEPACALGYAEAQFVDVVGEARLPALRDFLYGQTLGRCEGAPTCAEAHGIVVYERDVDRFVRHQR